MLNLLSAVLAASAVVISGSSDCPSAAAVQAILSQLLPGYESADSVYINQIGGELALELHSAVHGTVSHRRLPRRHSCAEQAAIAATVIAAWQSDSQSLADPAPPPPPAPVVVPPPPQVPAAPLLRYEAGGAVGGTVSEGTFTAGGVLDLLLLPGSRWAGVRLGLFGAGLRAVPIGAGQADWTRAGLRLGGGYRFLLGARRRFSIDCFADTSVAVTYVAGRGFEKVYESTALDLAVGGSVRLGQQLGRVRPFGELALTGWLRPQELRALSGSLQTATVPQVEAWLSVGIAVTGVKKRPAAVAP